MSIGNLFKVLFLFFSVSVYSNEQYSLLTTESSVYDLSFRNIAQTWDEGMPMGNGEIGALLWMKNGKLRLAIDRTDLWDLRPLSVYQGEPYTFKWIYNHVIDNNYKPVQDWYDLSKCSGPSKIPGAAIEFDISRFGNIVKNHLYLNQAVTSVEWDSGVVMQFFVHAEKPIGWFIIDNVKDEFVFDIVPPAYEMNGEVSGNGKGIDLHSLGYKNGKVVKNGNSINFEQKGWGNFSYILSVKWEKKDNSVIGVWSITSSESPVNASKLVDIALKEGIYNSYKTHIDWWSEFYAKSSVYVPDTLIMKQYCNEIYKMGCIAREDSYPISLQSVWTADDGKLPPWKGDYHHDLNTQLSYWPFYTSNHLEEAMGYLNTLWSQREINKKYTRQYFGTDGLNVPGVCTLKGEPMGGWIQYSLGPTVSSWLAHHFYLQWKYSQDRDFLKEYAYPYIKDVAIYLEEFTVMKNGYRTLLLSSSPEFNDNRLDAWFMEMSNFDRALLHFAFNAAAELAAELGFSDESKHWRQLSEELPDYDLDSKGGLTIAPGYDYKSSHRHFSHLMGIHPLGLIDISNGPADADIIKSSLANVDKCGCNHWNGYTYSWLASLKARNLDGDGALQALCDFASNFCLRNTFHANGDMKNNGKSLYKKRAFTLEGNMAFAAGLQEMLLQSHTGVVSVFPAIPKGWNHVEFKNFRTYGAFIVSSCLKNDTINVSCFSEKGGRLKLKIPHNKNFVFRGDMNSLKVKDDIIVIETKKGDKLDFIFN